MRVRSTGTKMPKDEEQEKTAKDYFVKGVLDWRNQNYQVSNRLPHFPDESICDAYYYIIGDLEGQLKQNPNVSLRAALIQLGEVWIDEKGRVFETQIDERFKVDETVDEGRTTEAFQKPPSASGVKYCSSCGAANPADYQFCIECGKRRPTAE